MIVFRVNMVSELDIRFMDVQAGPGFYRILHVIEPFLLSGQNQHTTVVIVCLFFKKVGIDISCKK